MKIVLLTGFLGSGKTTLLNRLIEAFKERKIGVIVNDFGKLNIDARLVKRDGVEMAELENGSVFCACIKDKFVESLVEMSKKDLDFLFIEASGLADPSNMGTILEGIRNATGDRLRFAGSICVADAATFMELSEMLPAIENQVKCAGAVMINKTDLAEPAKLTEIEEKIRSINRNAVILETSYAQADYLKLVNELHDPGEHSEESTNTYESRPVTVIVRGKGRASEDKIKEFMDAMVPYAFRIKGFLNTDSGTVAVSMASGVYSIVPWDEPEENGLVIISSVGIRLMSMAISETKKILGKGFAASF